MAVNDPFWSLTGQRLGDIATLRSKPSRRLRLLCRRSESSKIAGLALNLPVRDHLRSILPGLADFPMNRLASLEVCARSSLVVDVLVRLKSASFLWCSSGRPGASGEMDDKRGRERAPPEFISKNWSPQCDR
jgi:hypothetical protein